MEPYKSDGIIEIREITFDDLEKVCVIENGCFASPWSESMLGSVLLIENYTNLVICENGIVSGFIITDRIANDSEVLDIAVAKDSQGRGFGRRLMSEYIEAMRANGIVHIYLEARISNERAIGLYRSLGFKDDCVRKNYYDDPKEDALMMSLLLTEN
ncbi:MAG: ribosomal protein S18-alanine N-acetyltransferase [Catonella sp.]|nr:ribosomal protein S18-alanine N-acetyltransferase [Catonella sp.]MDY6356335.1 ribosomal protein S18-alanine N-acetyltransferase [Catonella sp.]